jgi:hypothetical protein
MVFATRVAEGAKGAIDCPAIDEENKTQLDNYLSRFVFVD